MHILMIIRCRQPTVAQLVIFGAPNQIYGVVSVTMSICCLSSHRTDPLAGWKEYWVIGKITQIALPTQPWSDAIDVFTRFFGKEMIGDNPLQTLEVELLTLET